MLVLVVIPSASALMLDDVDSVRREYLDRRSRAGVDATLHVDLALWCSDYGLEDESSFHLAMAVAHDPDNGRARGLMGQVKHQGRWVDPSVVMERDRKDGELSAKRSAYRRLRSRSGSTAADHERLARWCFRQGLDVEGKAHLHALVGQDPSRTDAWRELGYEQYRGQWLPRAEIATRQQEEREQSAANVRWASRFASLRESLEKRLRDAREAASRRVAAELSTIEDPRVVDAAWHCWIVEARGREDQRRGLGLLRQVATPASSEYLAAFAVLSQDEALRGEAIRALRRRDAREFVPMLIEAMADPIRYRVTPIGGSGAAGVIELEDTTTRVLSLYRTHVPRMVGIVNQIGTRGLYQIDYSWSDLRHAIGARWTVERLRNADRVHARLEAFLGQLKGMEGLPTDLRDRLDEVKLPEPSVTHSASLPHVPHGIGTVNQERFVAPYEQLQAIYNEMVRRKLISDVQLIERHNRNLLPWNTRVGEVIRLASVEGEAAAPLPGFADVGILEDARGDGQPIRPDFTERLPALFRESWRSWWADQIGIHYETPRREYVTSTDAPQVAIPRFGVLLASCFSAGTLVSTRNGSVPIERVKVGDQVLAQDVVTGELAYRAVQGSRQTRVAPTRSIELSDGEGIRATDIHRFWLTGQGWVMAQDLQPGDRLRSLGRTVAVASVSGNSAPVPVYNLEVVGTPTYFVGSSQVLVHDNTLPADPDRAFDQIAATETE